MKKLLLAAFISFFALTNQVNAASQKNAQDIYPDKSGIAENGRKAEQKKQWKARKAEVQKQRADKIAEREKQRADAKAKIEAQEKAKIEAQEKAKIEAEEKNNKNKYKK